MKGSIPFAFVVCLAVAFQIGLNTARAQVVPQPLHYDYKKAVNLYEEGLYAQSMIHFERFLETDPDMYLREEARYFLTLAEIALDSLNRETYIFRFLNDFPLGRNATRLLEDLAGRNFEDGMYPLSLERYQMAFVREEREPKKAEFLFWMAESARLASMPDSSSTMFRMLASRFPESEWAPSALYARAGIYLDREQFDVAAEVFEQLRSRYPNDPVTRQIGTALGEMYYRQGKYEDAIRALQAELPHLQDEALLKGVLLMAESYNYLTQFDRAAAQYRRYINLSRDEMQARPAHYGLGWVYHKQRVFHWAADYFGNAAFGDDELARKALYYEAVNRKLSGRFDLALEAFARFGEQFTEGPWVERAYYEWAVTAFELGRFDLAIEVLQDLVRGNTVLEQPGEVYARLGEAYFANGEFTRAVQAFEFAAQTTDVDPGLERQARFQRGWILYENHAWAEARQAFDRVYREDPEGPLAAEALFWMADSYFQLGQWDLAARSFERFVSANPNHKFAGAAIYSMGWAYFNRREFEQAANYFERFIERYEPPPMALFPYDVDTWLRLGDSYYALGRYERAIASYERAAEVENGGDYAVFQMGNSFFRNNESFEAVRSFRRLVSVFPESRLREQARYNIGSIYFQIGNYDQAIAEFHSVINQFPGTRWAARAQYQIGDSYYNAGLYQEAIEAYRLVLDEYPSSEYVVDAVNGIQFAQFAAGMDDTSLEILEDFLSRHPQTGTADQLRYRQAESHMQSGSYEEAIRSFRHYMRVTTSESMLPEALFNIGESYEQLQQFQQAIDSYTSLTERFPGSDRADHALLRIGRLEYERGRIGPSIDALEQLTQREGRLHVEALTSLGEAYLADNRLARAEASFDEALQRRAGYAAALIGKGRTALQRGLFMDAQRYLSQVAESSTTERGAEAEYYLGRVEQSRNNHEQAISHFARVSTLYEAFDHWVARAMLARAESYRATGQPGRRNQILRDVVERYPDTPYAEEAARQL